MPEPLTRVPMQLAANTSVAWRFDDSEFDPADGWTLSYAFEGPVELDVAAVADGAGFLVELTAAQTALAPGSYRWQAFAANVGPPAERIQVAAGRLEVVADLEAETGLGEQKNHAQKMCELLEAYIEGRATDGQLRMSINGRSIDRIPIIEARQLLRDYRIEAESILAGARPGKRRRIKVRF